jgi:hypothetical protein
MTLSVTFRLKFLGLGRQGVFHLLFPNRPQRARSLSCICRFSSLVQALERVALFAFLYAAVVPCSGTIPLAFSGIFESSTTRQLSRAAFLHLSFLALYMLLKLASGGPTNTYGSTRWEFRTDGATRSGLGGSLQYDDARRRVKEKMSPFAPMKLSTNLSENHRKGGCLSYATASLHFCVVSRHRLFRLKYQIENKYQTTESLGSRNDLWFRI